MKNTLLFTVLICYLLNESQQDVYLHNMRGSNNRLNEKSATRKNGQRVFDSQNNNRGNLFVKIKFSNKIKELLQIKVVIMWVTQQVCHL